MLLVAAHAVVHVGPLPPSSILPCPAPDAWTPPWGHVDGRSNRSPAQGLYAAHQVAPPTSFCFLSALARSRWSFSACGLGVTANVGESRLSYC